MPTGGNSALQIIAYVLASVLFAYGGGRVHQWYKHSMDRDRSFREGYSHGYHALFAVAARNTRLKSDRPGPIGQDDPDRHAPEAFRGSSG
ncbi:hypothetical protein [Actinoplanes sp. NPDC051411]|uniref:hypothetical protein n=1 Tax=Actinoplanes sp. NPDC051411 TaxID=3155522 RepID=UPI00342F2CF6